jgi:hypothetical protein
MSSCAHAIPFQKSIGRRISAMSSGKLVVPKSAKALQVTTKISHSHHGTTIL